MVRMPVLCPHCHSDQAIALREPFGLMRSYTDSWGACPRQLHADEHPPGKRNTQPIERQHLTWRTRSKRRVRKTMGFSRSTQRHDLVIGLLVNRYEVGLPV
jgi:insertion element IS1 protein InsB